MPDANQRIPDAIKILLTDRQRDLTEELACDPATVEDHAHGLVAGLIELATRLNVSPLDGSMDANQISADTARRAAMDLEEAHAESRLQTVWLDWRWTSH